MIQLTQKEFVDYIIFIKTKNQQQTDLCYTLETLSGNNSYCDAFIYNDYEDRLVRLLTKLMNDTTEVISYWLYECDYGDNFSIGKIIEADGSTPDIGWPAALYAYLVEKDKQNET